MSQASASDSLDTGPICILPNRLYLKKIICPLFVKRIDSAETFSVSVFSLKEGFKLLICLAVNFSIMGQF